MHLSPKTVIFQEKCFFYLPSESVRESRNIWWKSGKMVKKIWWKSGIWAKKIWWESKMGKSLSQQTQLHRPTKQDALADTYGFVGR